MNHSVSPPSVSRLLFRPQVVKFRIYVAMAIVFLILFVVIIILIVSGGSAALNGGSPAQPVAQAQSGPNFFRIENGSGTLIIFRIFAHIFGREL